MNSMIYSKQSPIEDVNQNRKREKKPCRDIRKI